MGVDKTESFQLPSRISSIDEAVARVLDFAGGTGFVEESSFAIDLAVREAVANAVKHGSGLEGSEPVEVSVAATDSYLEISVRDHGQGFVPEDVPDPTQPENILKSSGRGLLFIRNFMDYAEWATHPDGGTVVTMRKNR